MAKKYKFTQLIDVLPYPKNYKMTLIDFHSAIVSYVCNRYRPTMSFMRSVIDTLNILTYLVCSDGHIPASWNKMVPLENLPDIDTNEVEEFLQPMHLLVSFENIIWDVEPCDPDTPMKVSKKLHTLSDTSNGPLQSDINQTSAGNPVNNIQSSNPANSSTMTGDLLSVNNSENTSYSKYKTRKEDLYIQAPVVPRLDTSSIYASGRSGVDTLVIYNTLPRVPTSQRDISLTTDINLFTDKDLIKLYPDHFIPTRSSCMYDRLDDVEYDDRLGLIIPIAGFTSDQVKENIIKYPHIYQLKKCINGSLSTFYSTMEVDGNLLKLSEVWDERADTKLLPKTKEFFKEYSVRRYLLERDIEHITHQYTIVGGLEPFLTLFMTPDMYISYGFTDTVEIAKLCVQSRVMFKRSRNPIMRRLSYV